MKSKQILIYYIILMIIMLLWTSRSASPGMFFRVMFLIAVMLPGIVNRNGVLLAAMTCFWTISTYGYAYSFMPTMLEVYVAAVSLAILLFKYKVRYTFYGGGDYVIPLLLFLTCMRNMLGGWVTDDLVYVLILFLLTHYLLPSINKQTINNFQLSFMSITVVLSLSILSMGEDFYNIIDEMSRVGWNDPNYLGMIIGMGGCVGAANLLRFKALSHFQGIISIASIGLAAPAILSLASRGAMLCLVVSVVLLLIMSTGNLYIRFLVVLSGAIYLYYLHTNEYFDLLEARINEDDGTGSGRLTIWSAKWNAFINRDSLLELFIGVGRKLGFAFGATADGKGLGFHNDFLAFLVSYGVMGVSLFVTLLMQPLRDIRRHSPYRAVIIANVAYLVICCFTLEPFFLGYFPFYAFLMYTMLLTRVKYN